ncbi:MAG: 6-carboxytetrahydropterin synthase [Bryobacteraceae bacterium]
MWITRQITFSASHFCSNGSLSHEENVRFYGASANPHGHNYVLEVTLDGTPDPATGMVFDLKELKGILQREVMEPMDHRSLNHEVPPFDHVVPTVENIAVEIWKRLQPSFSDGAVRLHNVRLYETSDLYVDYGGEPCV